MYKGAQKSETFYT